MLNRISVIIPTRGYSTHLEETLNSLLYQTKKPYEIILVSSKMIYNKIFFKNKLNLKIIYSKKSNQIIQRNIGLKNLSKNTDVLLQLDDRVVLNKNCIEELLNSWKVENKNIIGIGLNITNEKSIFGIINKILNYSGIKGRIPFFGLNFDYSNLHRDKQVSWLKGGSSSWILKKNKRIHNRKFPLWKWCVFEDIDYCFEKKTSQHLMICSNAKATILKSKKLSLRDSFERGIINSLSIKRLIHKYSKILITVYLMNIFLILFSLFKSVVTLNLLNFYFSLGRLFGFFRKNAKF